MYWSFKKSVKIRVSWLIDYNSKHFHNLRYEESFTWMKALLNLHSSFNVHSKRNRTCVHKILTFLSYGANQEIVQFQIKCMYILAYNTFIFMTWNSKNKVVRNSYNMWSDCCWQRKTNSDIVFKQSKRDCDCYKSNVIWCKSNVIWCKNQETVQFQMKWWKMIVINFYTFRVTTLTSYILLQKVLVFERKGSFNN